MCIRFQFPNSFRLIVVYALLCTALFSPSDSRASVTPPARVVRDVRAAAFSYMLRRGESIYGPGRTFYLSDGCGYFDTAHDLDARLLRRLREMNPGVDISAIMPIGVGDKHIDIDIDGPDLIDSTHAIVSAGSSESDARYDDSRRLLLIRRSGKWAVDVKPASFERLNNIRLALMPGLNVLDAPDPGRSIYLSYKDIRSDQGGNWKEFDDDPDPAALRRLSDTLHAHVLAGSQKPANASYQYLEVGPATVIDDRRALVLVTDNRRDPSMANTDAGPDHVSYTEYLVTRRGARWSVTDRGGASSE